MESRRCTIVIPLFNQAEYTEACLEALVRTTPDDLYEIVLVDNGSSDRTSDLLDMLDGDVIVIRNERNLGFAVASNQGAARATTDFVLFLNNDTVPLPGWLPPLLDAMAEPDVGAVGARLLFPDGTLQHAGVMILDNRLVHPPVIAGAHRFYRRPGDHSPANERADVQAVTAAAMLVRRSAFDAVGGFDEGYWNGNEDVDLCLALRASAWRVVYEPASTLFHHESVSGPERFRKVGDNERRLSDRWRGRVVVDGVVGGDKTTRSPTALPSAVSALL